MARGPGRNGRLLEPVPEPQDAHRCRDGKLRHAAAVPHDVLALAERTAAGTSGVAVAAAAGAEPAPVARTAPAGPAPAAQQQPAAAPTLAGRPAPAATTARRQAGAAAEPPHATAAQPGRAPPKPVGVRAQIPRGDDGEGRREREARAAAGAAAAAAATAAVARLAAAAVKETGRVEPHYCLSSLCGSLQVCTVRCAPAERQRDTLYRRCCNLCPF
mmetsp:Transcript_12596/g.41522  ORF Transcript_12596/g.41522 Transcript_12596/m.41522 type:complete len:216 (-) Transcript_12596:242-889(-)